MSKETIVRCKRLYNGLASRPLENACLVVSDGLIANLGSQQQVVTPPDAEVFDLGEWCVLPGLIDSHAHFYGVPSTRLTSAPFEDPAYRSLRAAGEARRMLEAGFTAARCCGSSVGPALRRAIEDGHVPGPRLIAAGEFVCTTRGTFDPNGHFSIPLDWAKAEGMLADGADGVRELVRRRVRSGSTLIKVGLSKGDWHGVFPVWGVDPFEQELSMTEDEIRAVLHEAKANRLRVSAHCIGDKAVQAAIEFGVDTIEHGFGISDETRKRLVDRNMIVVTTLTVMILTLQHADLWGFSQNQKRIIQKHIDAQCADFEKGLNAGVRFALGTDLVGSPTHPNELAAKEFELAVMFGMTPDEAIVAGTSIGAAALGLEDTIGTIEVGKMADIIAVADDPVRDIRTLQDVKFVMQGGDVIVNRQGW